MVSSVTLEISLSSENTHSFTNILPEYVSTTMDWWPPSDIAWGNASVINADLSHPMLLAATKGLSPFYLRIGGSQADEIMYNFPSTTEVNLNTSAINEVLEAACSKKPQKCLTSNRWEEVLNFAHNSGARLVFTLAYVLHTRDINGTNDVHDWDSSNARSLLEYTANSEYAKLGTVYGFELGNELRHKNKIRNVTRIAGAYQELRRMVDGIWDKGERVNYHKPLLFGPASTGKSETSNLLASLGEHIDIVTYHKYHGGGKDPKLPNYVRNPSYFNHPMKLSDQGKAIQKYMANNTMKPQLWVGEGALAYNSGAVGVTDSFLGSLWFANLLGVLTKTDPVPHSVYCRQALIGGYYELISHETLTPNPDYWVAFMFKNVIGASKAIGPILSPQRKDSLHLSTLVTFGCCKKPGQDTVLVHAFCSNSNNDYGSSGDVVFVVINVSTDKAVDLDVPLGTTRTEFVLIPNNHGLKSREVLLNGEVLAIGESATISDVRNLGVNRQSNETIHVPPISISFIVVHGANIKQCMSSSKTTMSTTPSDDKELMQQTQTTTRPTMSPTAVELPQTKTPTSAPPIVPAIQSSTQTDSSPDTKMATAVFIEQNVDRTNKDFAYTELLVQLCSIVTLFFVTFCVRSLYSRRSNR
eukprot:g2378.t1 g2378   contig11:1345778-1347700(+)